MSWIDGSDAVHIAVGGKIQLVAEHVRVDLGVGAAVRGALARDTFLRRAADPADFLLVCCNFTPVPRKAYEFGVPEPGVYHEILNTDSELFGGSNFGSGGMVSSHPIPKHNRKHSIAVNLPPLGVVVFRKG